MSIRCVEGFIGSLITCAVILFPAGCAKKDGPSPVGASSTSIQSYPTPSDDRPLGPASIAQRERTYSTFGELRSEATAVVIARATTTTEVDRIEGIPFTVREFDIVRALSGALAGTVRVRELGLETQSLTTRGGTDYVLFLQPFEFERGVQFDDQWYAVGGPAGVFVLDGDTVVRTDPASPEIPLRTPLETVAAAVAG